mgnify:CR=1 FL=1
MDTYLIDASSNPSLDYPISVIGNLVDGDAVDYEYATERFASFNEDWLKTQRLVNDIDLEEDMVL